ncbi:hypothetical protein Undi14_04500 [Undibacterium sp. 14-3-2]|uniref:hypothetical protein n=1 Tax=Undibacterium sp. 14-3-2 TaxID=2800129 RepID=UPI00190459DD|nr:hypothetical protein [Undibacterium sp. 14-3-2]MBK1889283.1 hypothetical protein [Undibacterium sp. 14-3-2]
MNVLLKLLALLIALVMTAVLVLAPSVFVSYVLPLVDVWFFAQSEEHQRLILLGVKWVAPAIALLCLLFLLIALALKTIRQKNRNQPESAGFTPLAADAAHAGIADVVADDIATEVVTEAVTNTTADAITHTAAEKESQ